jgi:hypothetical protein
VKDLRRFRLKHKRNLLGQAGTKSATSNESHGFANTPLATRWRTRKAGTADSFGNSYRGTIHMLGKLRTKLGLAFWSLQKRRDRNRRLTSDQEEMIISYHTRAMNIFQAIGIDVESKSVETRRIYNMMLLYLDRDETICPSEARTASLIGFLDSLGSGWTLPPTSVSVSKEFAEEVDGYMAVEIFGNHLGMEDIRDEIANAIAKFKTEHPS